MRKFILITVSLLLSICILFTSVSCTVNPITPKYQDKDISVENLLGKYSSRTDKSGIQVTQDFKDALVQFSFDICKAVTKKDGNNVAMSPLSIYICLAMIANGADGDTKAQMEDVLGMSIADINKGLYALLNGFTSSENCKLDIANSVWFKDDNILKIQESYLQEIADWYESEIYKAPFDKQTLEDVNNWSSNKTKGLIDKILDYILDNDEAFILNAVLFDAKWRDEYTSKDILNNYKFNNIDKTTTTVTMLKSEEHVVFMGTDYIGTKKDYDGQKYSFVVLLPNEDVDFYEFVNFLDKEKWNEIMTVDKNPVTVSLLMPEFEVKTDMMLNPALQMLGIKDAFGNKANFGKMAEITPDCDLYLSRVIQRAYVKVDRVGTKAAASTIGAMTNKSASNPQTIIVDRPYVYAIIDNDTNCPIFVGLNVKFS